MTNAQKQLETLQSLVNDAWGILDLDASFKRVRELEAQMEGADFWQNQDQAKLVSKEVSERKAQINVWKKMRDDVNDALELLSVAQEEENVEILKSIQNTADDLEKEYQKLELQILLSGEMDVQNAIVSIHAGAGGADAMDWAGMLMRMLSRYCEGKDWIINVLESSQAEEGGYKSISFEVRGRYAYGYLKSEAGVHRLVRISPFDAEKMRHTSFALVEVIPELDSIAEKNISIDDKDLRVDTFMSGGHGGQSVNTTYSAVRVTHIPTNTVVVCQNERSQSQNRESALRVLKSRLFQRMLQERAEKIEELKGPHKSPEWGNQIRSYVIHPYKMVKDHRTEYETQDVDSVLNGDLQEFIESYLRKQAQK